MKEDITLHMDTEADGFGYRISARLPDPVLRLYGSAVVGEVLQKITSKIVDLWMEKYGAETLELLSPEVVAKAVATQVAKKVLG